MDLFEAIAQRQSVRSFARQPVPKEDLVSMVNAARLAPSGRNKQKWKFVVINQEEDLAWFESFEGMDWVAQAPALVIVTLDPSTEFWREDGSAAIENLLLAATALGYGACWVQGQIEPYEEELKNRYGIPQSWRVLAVVPIGKPNQTAKTKTKKSLSEVLSFGKF